MDVKQIQAVIKSLRKDATTSGITVGTGLNFYYLEPQAKAIYPVFYPLLASVPRTSPMFNGVKVGGTGVNWKAIVSIDSGGYPGVSEGNRNSVMQLQEKDYFAPYKFLGKETQVSFQAQQTGLGLDDNIGIAQASMLNALLNDEERMLLYGNSGASQNGFTLGQATGLTGTPATAGATTYYVAVVALTGWGVQMCTKTGVQLPFARTNADGSQDTINGGTSQISAITSIASAAATVTPTNKLTLTCTDIPGALGYAFYVGTSNALSALKFYGVSSYPGIVVTALPPGGNQAGNASNGTGMDLTADHSANTLDFDGLITWAVNYATAAMPSYYKNMNGAALTAVGDGTIAEVETALDFFWTNYKITIDKIWLGGTLIDSFSKAILAAGQSNAVTRLLFETDAAGRLIGGTFPIAYRSKFGPGTVKQLDVQTHPWLPEGTILFDLVNNPYPAAANAIPSVRQVVSLEDHFSIRWPYRRLQHEVGVYCFEMLRHYIPFGIGLITGAGGKQII